MNTKVGLQHDKARQKPWRAYWFGEADPETGRQRKYVKSFKHSREAREFQVEKQAELNRGGTTILLITHDYKLVHHYAHRAVLLRDGRIVADGAVKSGTSFSGG